MTNPPATATGWQSSLSGISVQAQPSRKGRNMPEPQILAPLAALVIAMMSAPSAHADANDDQFISQARALGVTVPAEQLIPAGHAVCDQFDNPGPFFGIAGPIVSLGVAVNQSLPVAYAAGRAYCLDKLHARGLQ